MFDRLAPSALRDDTAARSWNDVALLDALEQLRPVAGGDLEMTERESVEEVLRAMVNELNHRVKNILSTVQSITLQSSLGAGVTVRRTLEGRLMALASVHDVLTATNWQGADLIDVANRVLEPFRVAKPNCLTVSGPVLRLRPCAAQTIALGLHELATNAEKYGALSRADGHVQIIWEELPGAVPMFRLTWRERGGPDVYAPTTRGFGIRMIERAVAQDLGGSVMLRFDQPEGLTCRMETVMADVIAPQGMQAFLSVGRDSQAAR